MATVSVACRLPHGLHLQLYQFVDTPAGRISQPVGERVTLNGANHPDAIAGWGLTENVDKSFIEKWVQDNADLHCVKEGMIMVREKVSNVIAEAKEKRNKKTGLEPLDPNKLPAGLTAVTDKDKV